jgi:hypothetical protein
MYSVGQAHLQQQKPHKNHLVVDPVVVWHGYFE